MEKNFIETGFTQIDNMLITNTKISDGAFRTYMVLVMHDLERKYIVWPGQGTIAKYRGKNSRKTIITHLQELQKLGLIEIHKRLFGGSGSPSNEYMLVYEARKKSR